MKTIAILATLDTKAAEADLMRQEIESLGGQAHIVDIGVIGEAGIPAQTTREEVVAARRLQSHRPSPKPLPREMQPLHRFRSH